MSVEKLDFQKVTKEQLPYTLILNSVIQKIRDPLAGFVWIYLSSLPSDWNVNKEHLKSKFNLGDNTLKLIFSYLRRANLIEYLRERDEQGKLRISIIHVLSGTSFDENESYLKTTGSDSEPMDKTTGSKTRRLENQTSGSGALQKKQHTKEKKETKEIVILPEWLSEEDWSDFVNHRKSIKSPMSENAQVRAINALAKLKEAKHNISEVINQSIVNGWKGLFPVKNQTQQGSRYGNQRKSAAAIHFDSCKGALKGTIYDPDFNENPF